MADESLDEWAERRDAHRPAPGARRAVPLGGGSARGGHADPGAPRGMLEWDGHRCTDGLPLVWLTTTPLDQDRSGYLVSLQIRPRGGSEPPRRPG
ncbi:DUF6087 family protein [Streptomyces sp. NPDC002215]|uniref:DUF6087 family protein n=1 Tax=Streptomyces sp. NPDC002215 TaxID=3154412 RepID=UPI0033345FB1